MLPYLSALENAIVFKGALKMSRFTFTLLFDYGYTFTVAKNTSSLIKALEKLYGSKLRVAGEVAPSDAWYPVSLWCAISAHL